MSKLIIFDLDGVLVDACEWHRLALNMALKEVCNYEISLADHKETFNGLPTRVKLRILTDMGLLNIADQEAVYDRKQELTINIIKRYASPRLEKILLIEYLKYQGATVACYTNSIRKTANLMLEATGVLHLLDAVLTNQDVQNPKPDPEGYNLLIDKFGFNKNDVFIIEDSPKGKQAAYDSKCNVIEVNNPDDVTIKLFKGYFE